MPYKLIMQLLSVFITDDLTPLIVNISYTKEYFLYKTDLFCSMRFYYKKAEPPALQSQAESALSITSFIQLLYSLDKLFDNRRNL